MSVETRESVALGMREAEVAQLRAVVDDLREEVRRKAHRIYTLESLLRSVSTMNSDVKDYLKERDEI